MIKKTTTPKTKMKAGGVAGAKAGAKKKMAAGGMSMGTKQCGPGDGCQTVKKANVFQKIKQSFNKKRNSDFGRKKLKRTRV
jgi:succinyl-CoA synthetase alpha subunit